MGYENLKVSGKPGVEYMDHDALVGQDVDEALGLQSRRAHTFRVEDTVWPKMMAKNDPAKTWCTSQIQQRLLRERKLSRYSGNKMRDR